MVLVSAHNSEAKRQSMECNTSEAKKAQNEKIIKKKKAPQIFQFELSERRQREEKQEEEKSRCCVMTKKE